MISAVAIYLCMMAVMSGVSYAAYGLDKRRAVDGGRRVPERTLHVLAILGGWPGALGGQRAFRHKTKKIPFLIVFWFIVAIHIGILGMATYVWLDL